ncbi:GGDEF domain-containing protein [uncultured Vibrio sp.]|uniref:GGDEF domain-containing protein n=1 Tax=uncultured Vibrio sp. TaxID=114054 RepID=UPI00262698EC|nr:GGDEF domain-containing protein [uncultured Vibrio sp.]
MYEYLDMLVNNSFDKQKFDDIRSISNLAEQEKFKVITQAIHISIDKLTDAHQIKACIKVGLNLINEQQKVLEEEYTYDQLTGLRNFNYLSKLDELFMDKNTLLMFFDINNMKHHNDVFGHAHGNDIIATFSGVLQDSVRSSDVVIRYGGDEFIVLCANALGKVSTIIERIETNIELKSLGIEFSLGWAYNLNQNFSETLKSADSDMYFNKKWMKENGETKTYHLQK